MRRKPFWMRIISLVTAVLLALPLPAMAQNGDTPPPQFSQEELAQLVAPIALYPDELVAQILMASTYPLEIVEADRWVQQNKSLNGDSLAKALEQKGWDPSVKSLVNFPSVLTMMSQKLEVTSKLGDAFLNQEKELMATVQALRKRAYDAGNLQATPEQKVVVEKETIIIQPANPQVIYVPTYSPTVVYGAWMYPAYPPYPYYAYPPPAYGGAFAFTAGVAVGMAWGYAWGGCNWHGGSVNVNVYRNTTVNNTYINRTTYQKNYQNRGMVGQNGQGTWQHDPAHRKGVAYRNPATAQKYGQSPARASQAGRDARGYGDSRSGGSQSAGNRGSASQGPKGGQGRGSSPSGGSPGGHSPSPQQSGGNKGSLDQGSRGGSYRSGASSGGGSAGRTPTPPVKGSISGSGQSGGNRSAAPSGGNRGGGSSGGRDSAFNPTYGDGASTRAASDRGQSSRQQPGGGYGGAEGGSRSGGGGESGGGGHGGGHGGGGRR